MDLVNWIVGGLRSWLSSFTDEMPQAEAPTPVPPSPQPIPWSFSEAAVLRAEADALENLLQSACFEPAETRRMRSSVIVFRTWADALDSFNNAYLRQQ